eukprot:2793060-Lingulodinium_polyedra.AAC.1
MLAGNAEPVGLGPLGEAAAAAPAALPPPPGLAIQRRGVAWPPGSPRTPWRIAGVFSNGIQVGWGATCNEHTNASEIAEGLQRVCKKQLVTSRGLTSEQAKRRIMHWLVLGCETIPPGAAQGRAEHLALNPRALDDVPEDELVRRARLLHP